MACDDPEIFAFEQLPADSEYQLTITGPDGQFTAHADFRDANSGVTTPLPWPPGGRALDAAPGKAHVVTIILFFVAACTVKVEATCNGKNYCRQIDGAPGDHPILVHILRMA